MRSLRTRLVATIIGLVVVTAVVLAGLAYVMAERSLRSQLVDDAVDRASFNIGVLATEEELPADAGPSDLESGVLVDRFLLRGTAGVVAIFPDGQVYASELSLVGADQSVSDDLRQIVASGDLGWEFVDVGGEERLIVGGRRPAGPPDLYFVFSTETIASSLSQLIRVLAIAAAAVVVVGSLIAGLVARQVLRPVHRSAQAARQMAAGDLDVRIPVEGGDEFARWADSFNQMAGSLQATITQLQQARARERRFVADVSHELRTPMTGLVNEAAMLAALLERRPEVGDERRVAALLRTDVARMRDLVEDLLEVSRLDTSSPDVDRVDVDIAGFVSAVIDDRLAGASLRVDGPMPPVETDRRSLERILGNILDNARLHAGEAGVSVAVTLDGTVLRLTVADSGPGADPADLPYLFDRFFKGDRSREGGSGLGLAIARQHARLLGGDITVRAGAERGLVFEVAIPVTASLPDGEAAATRPGQAGGESTAEPGGQR